MATDPTIDQTEDDDAPLVASSKARAEAVKRLQIGLAGLVTMLLLVSLANIIQDRAKESELTRVPDATSSGGATSATNKDPLADAGVVPELSSESAAPTGNASSGN